MPPDRPPPSVWSAALGVVSVLAGALLLWLFLNPVPRPPSDTFASQFPAASPALAETDTDLAARLDALAAISAETRAALAARLRAILNRANVRPDEGILLFKTDEAYRRFLAGLSGSGASLLGRIDALRAIRVHVADYPAFIRSLGDHAGEFASIGANPVLSATPPPVEDRAARSSVAVGPNLLSVLGVTGSNSSWGLGVTVAVLDSGAAPVATLGPRLQYLDIGYGTFAADSTHGTAVAALVGGASPSAPGVAPSANVLSIRVTTADGTADTFSVTQGILAALSAGAKVVNISLGGYSTSPLLGEAIDQALASGVAIVASSGNDQAARLAWPAAYEGVVSVGAVDALGQQAIFSNSGPGLQLTAPGTAIQTAGPGGTLVNFSGTSASAPVVSGAIAALLSQTPGLTPLQAADLLATYSNDGGLAGTDPDYGRGTLNLGWAIDRANPARVDPALSSQTYDSSAGVVSIVVQNRGAQPVSGLGLSVALGNASAATLAVPPLAPGASTTLTVPASTTPGVPLTIRSQLLPPTGLNDQNLTNNRQLGQFSP